MEALHTAKYITYSMQRRGVSWGANIFSGAIQMGKDSLVGALVMMGTDMAINLGIAGLTYATGGATAHLASIRAVQQIRKYSKIFNSARKKYKTLRYGWNISKLVGYQMAGAKLDTLSRTYIFENLLPIQNRRDRITQKRNNWMLEFTDKGGLYINDLSQETEDFIERQDDVEQYDEALGERIVAPLLRPIISAFPIPQNIANSIFAKTIKKINNFPRIVGTSFDGILEEHAEEVFTSVLNHLRKANDPNTTLGQTLKEYFDPENFTINTINMMISGGLIKTLHPSFTQNKDNSLTESLNRATVKTYFKNLFNRNPDLILNSSPNNPNTTAPIGSIDQYNYENTIDSLPETEIDKLAKEINKKDQEQSEVKYQEQKNNLKNSLISSGRTEAEANNLIKLFEGNYENLARALNVSKSNMVEELKLMVESKNVEKAGNNNNTFYQTTPLDLTNDFVNIKSTDPNIVASTVEAYLNTLINKEINTATNPLRIKIIGKNKAHIENSNLPLTKGQQQRHNTTLKNLVDIINNSILDNSRSGAVDLTHNSNRTRNRKARQVDSYRYFKTQIKINNDIYDVELTTEVLKNSKDKDVSDLYNVRVKKATPTLSVANNSLQSFSGSQPNNNINNSKSQGIIQHQDAKGQITFLKNKAIITLFNGKADQSTILHELAHYYLETIRRFAEKDNPTAQQMLKEVKEWTASKITKKPLEFMHERFARSYEYYIRTGKFEGKERQSFMKDIFEYFKKFLEGIYKSLKDLQLENDEIDKVKMEKFFDRYLFNPKGFVEKDDNSTDGGLPRFARNDVMTSIVNPLTPLTKGGSPKDRGFKPLRRGAVRRTGGSNPYEGGSPKDRGFKPLTNGGSNDETTTELPHDDETTTELPHDDETTTQQQEPLSDYILKTNLLYFKSTPAVDMTAEHQLEILNSLGNFIKESKEKQDQLRADRFAELLKDKNETIDLIQTNAIKKDAVANGRVLDGKGILFNTKKMLVSHIGNLPTILDYIGGKELADKFNFIPIETANRVNVKQKIDKVFKDMFNIIDKNKETI